MCVNGELIETHEWSIEWAHPRPPMSPQTGGEVEKSPFDIAAKRLELDHMCQYETFMNTWAGYRMSSPRSPCTPIRGVVNRQPQIEHIMWGRQAA